MTLDGYAQEIVAFVRDHAAWAAPIADSAIKHVDPFHLTAIRYFVATFGFLALLCLLPLRALSRTAGLGLAA